MSFVVAIDGPAGTGKGTITEIISKRMNLVNIDTGATYRCVTLAMIERNIKLEEIEKIKELLKEIKIEIKVIKGKQVFFLDGKDVSSKIRTKEVTQLVSPVSSIKEVRYALTEIQRKMAEKKDVIMEGRDIGTCVFPKAEVKIYLDAEEEERVKRRYKQNKEKNIEMTYEEVRKNIRARDKNDREKEVGALKQANDAIYIDTTNMSIRQVSKTVEKIINDKKKEIKEDENAYRIRKDTKEKQVERTITTAILSFLFKTYYRVKETGKENIPETGGYIICANHVNALDALGIVLLNKRKIKMVAKHELFRNRIISWLGHLYDVIPIKREKQDIDAMKRCLKTIKSGEILAIFPEGTRNGLEKKQKVKSGAAYMALKTGAPIIPVGISGTFKPFSKITYNYGKPIDFSKNQDASQKPDTEEVTEEIMKNILELVEK